MGGGGREDCHKIDNRRSNRSCNAVREYKLRLIFDYINVVDDTCYGSSIENIYIFDRKIIFFFFFLRKRQISRNIVIRRWISVLILAYPEALNFDIE